MDDAPHDDEVTSRSLPATLPGLAPALRQPTAEQVAGVVMDVLTAPAGPQVGAAPGGTSSHLADVMEGAALRRSAAPQGAGLPLAR